MSWASLIPPGSLLPEMRHDILWKSPEQRAAHASLFGREFRQQAPDIRHDTPGIPPYAVAMEAAMLAPKGEVSMFPWREPKERVPPAVRQIRSFLRAHRSASA